MTVSRLESTSRPDIEASEWPIFGFSRLGMGKSTFAHDQKRPIVRTIEEFFGFIYDLRNGKHPTKQGRGNSG
jgi:hypothetical protein